MPDQSTLRIRPARLAVIGNIARVEALYPDGSRCVLLGGAALHIALAAARAGMAVIPVSVIGTDLEWIAQDARLTAVNLSAVKVVRENSCAFRLTYNRQGELITVDSSYGASTHLTDHALDHIGRYNVYHVCCRHPLDAARVLRVLAQRDLAFSVDFFVSSAPDMIVLAAPMLPSARVVFTNVAEHRALSATVRIDELSSVVVTDGARPARLLRHGSEIARATPPPTASVEVIGAGDIVVGTFFAAQETGCGEEEALRAAVSAASLHVSGAGLKISLPYA